MPTYAITPSKDENVMFVLISLGQVSGAQRVSHYICAVMWDIPPICSQPVMPCAFE